MLRSMRALLSSPPTRSRLLPRRMHAPVSSPPTRSRLLLRTTEQPTNQESLGAAHDARTTEQLTMQESLVAAQDTHATEQPANQESLGAAQDAHATEQPTNWKSLDVRATEQPTNWELLDVRATEQPTGRESLGAQDTRATEQPADQELPVITQMLRTADQELPVVAQPQCSSELQAEMLTAMQQSWGRLLGPRQIAVTAIPMRPAHDSGARELECIDASGSACWMSAWQREELQCMICGEPTDNKDHAGIEPTIVQQAVREAIGDGELETFGDTIGLFCPRQCCHRCGRMGHMAGVCHIVSRFFDLPDVERPSSWQMLPSVAADRASTCRAQPLLGRGVTCSIGACTARTGQGLRNF